MKEVEALFIGKKTVNRKNSSETNRIDYSLEIEASSMSYLVCQCLITLNLDSIYVVRIIFVQKLANNKNDIH